MQLIDKSLLDSISGQAKTGTRLRMNFNFHTGADASSQRLLNALEPGTELPIHRHRHTAETYVLLRGRMNVLFYDANKCLLEKALLDPAVGSFGVNIPAGQWHTVEVLEAGTVIFECKDGPYTPLEAEDLLP